MQPHRNAFQRWAFDEHGSITVEFVIWMPLLAFWFVVSVAFFDAYKSRSDASKAAHTITDLISRQVDVDEAFLDELFALKGKLLPRVPSNSLMRISSIQYDINNDQYQVVWSSVRGSALPLTDIEVPIALLPQMAHLDSIILTELSVPYQPFTSWAGIDVTDWDFAIVSRPRFVTAIVKTD